MQIALLQNNPKLGNITDNSMCLISMINRLGLESEALCLTSSFGLCGNPWQSIAFIGGFSQRMQHTFDLISQTPHRILAQNFNDKPVWILKGNRRDNSQKQISKTQKQGEANAADTTSSNVFADACYHASANISADISADVSAHTFGSNTFPKRLSATHSFDQISFDQNFFEIDSIQFFAPHNITHCALNNLQIPQATQIVYLACADRFYEGLDLENILTHFAKRINLPVIYLNTCGATDGIVYAGKSMLITQNGEVLARLQAFEEDTFIFEFDGTNITCTPKIIPHLEDNAALFMGASLAIKDYAKKCGIKQALIGISGGMDSALVAALACEALGSHNVLGLMMPSKYSSDHSLADAILLMQNLEMSWHTIPISSITEAFEKTLEPSFSSLTALPDMAQDLTPDNIQARTRGNLLMAFANRTSRMVIGTGNKSEAAMGYCTLYGDTVGALEPISDIYKTRVYHVAKWYNTWKKTNIIPENIFTKAPSAELRPDQKDEDTLPPYPLLDKILEQILENGVDPNSINDPELSDEDKHIILSRLAASEFKRKQSPFVVALSSCAFGHVWTPPITSKAF